ncbi:MAG: arginine--tRNA ligase, partial [Planctomycetota bacterium]
MNLRKIIDDRIAAALAAAGAVGMPALVGQAANPKFGDYQANGVMAAAKAAKANPRELAEKVLANLDLSDLAEKVEIAGPGFINVTLKGEFLTREVGNVGGDEKLGIPKPPAAATVVVDYSSPNLAKEMHVGHLRSTIIGDALVRVLRFAGHTVIPQNHVGDWGTQFGMLIAQLVEAGGGEAAKIDDLEDFYRQAKKRFDTEPAFADKARDYVVKLQGGDAGVKALWHAFNAVSLEHCERVYQRLGTLLTRENVRGESAYNDDLATVVADLKKAGLLEESQGAQCVFLPEFKNKDGEPLPVLVQKTDGGYLYATTDLAAMRYRAGELKAHRVLYVTDSRQGLHFQQVFAVARMAGFVGAGVSLEHVPFGMMMGTDNRPFKTRDGGTVKLMDLLEEAQKRAAELIAAKNPELPEPQRAEIARVVGVGAVKYADLSQNRASDYVFSWEKMLSLEGNTAPYMQYAYARVRSIFRKAGEAERPADMPSRTIQLTEPAERALALGLLQFPEAIETVVAECLPNNLCAYLYDLARSFTTF